MEPAMQEHDTSLAKQLRADEGSKRYAYEDSRGYLTIGIGRLIDKRVHGGISVDEEEYLFANDLAKIEAEIDRAAPWLRELDPVRLGAVKNMVFQMGMYGVLQFKNTLALMRAHRYEDAARNVLKSLYAKQTPERALRISEQIRTGAWQFQ
jgi:lysozyme